MIIAQSSELPPSVKLDATDIGRAVLERLIHPRGSAKPNDALDTPTRGSTMYLGAVSIKLEFGTFTAHAFETSEYGKHVIALSMGDISTKDPLLVRLHSECITSETLRGCDCDCVEQLNGALERIGLEGRGILFYLRQEGRGAGYSCKGRDRMGVAASNDSLDTFELYRAMGLEPDPRSYVSLKEIVYLLDLQAPLRVMTNNPKKIEALESIGLPIHQQCPLDIAANPYNVRYLEAKRLNGGHMLGGSALLHQDYPWAVEAFRPHKLPEAMRFVHMAAYPLPVKPEAGIFYLSQNEVEEVKKFDGGNPILDRLSMSWCAGAKIVLDQRTLEGLAASPRHEQLWKFLSTRSLWFNDYIYHDSVSQLDYVALRYESKSDSVPLVRVQSESLFQRFPLNNGTKDRAYEKAVSAIVENGKGLILLYPEDGRGNGFASYFQERLLVESKIASTYAEAAEKLGVKADSRDYSAIAKLIKHHYGSGPISLVHSTKASSVQKTELIRCLGDEGISLKPPTVLGLR